LFGTNRAVLFSVFVAVFMGCGLFEFKYKVASLNSQARKLEKEITQTQCNIKILSAELQYLTTPKRLQSLANRHFSLDKAEVNQLFSLREVKDYFEGKTPTVERDSLQSLLTKASTVSRSPKK
jgi:hypothetical protein